MFNLCRCRYCVVLLTGEGEKYAESYQAFLAFAVANTKETLRFVHIYGDHQQEFARTLLQGDDLWSQAKSTVSVLPPPPGPQGGWQWVPLFLEIISAPKPAWRVPSSPKEAFEDLWACFPALTSPSVGGAGGAALAVQLMPAGGDAGHGFGALTPVSIQKRVLILPQHPTDSPSAGADPGEAQQRRAGGVPGPGGALGGQPGGHLHPAGLPGPAEDGRLLPLLPGCPGGPD